MTNNEFRTVHVGVSRPAGLLPQLTMVAAPRPRSGNVLGTIPGSQVGTDRVSGVAVRAVGTMQPR